MKESLLIYLIYNFRRVMNILGLPEVEKSGSPGCFFYFTDRAFH